MNIKFNFQKAKDQDIYGIEIYRKYTTQNNEERWSYIDTVHAMNSQELIVLKNAITQFVGDNDRN